MIFLAWFQEDAPAFLSKVGLVVTPWMRLALSRGSMSDFTAESQKMRGDLEAGCLRRLPFLSAFTTGISCLRWKRAVLLTVGVNMSVFPVILSPGGGDGEWEIYPSFGGFPACGR